MKVISLSERLYKIAKKVPKGKKVADIGSDHGLLPSYLVKEEVSPFAVAGEVNEGPLQAARRQITNLNLEDKVDVRKGDGLSVIQSDEVDVITIAGMGGALIVDILEKGKEKLKGIKKLILQPNVGEHLVRIWLDNNQWNIVDEEILEEDGKIYEIIAAEPRDGNNDPIYEHTSRTKEELYRLGSILWNNKSDVLLKKWKQELQKNHYILNQLQKSKNEEEMESKKKSIEKEIQWMSEVVSCLQKDKI